MKTVYNSTKLAPHGRRRRTDATLAIGMERERRKTETMIPERERPPNADAPAGVVVVAQRAVYPRRSRRHWLSPADGAIRGGVGAEGGARRRASPSQGRAWSCLPTERRAGRRAEAEGCCGSVATGAGCGGVGESAVSGGRPLVGDVFARSARGIT